MWIFFPVITFKMIFFLMFFSEFDCVLAPSPSLPNLPGIIWTSWSYGFIVFTKFGIFLPFFPFNIFFSDTSFNLPSGTPIILELDRLIFSLESMSCVCLCVCVCFFFSSLFFLCASFRIVYIVILWRSLIFFILMCLICQSHSVNFSFLILYFLSLEVICSFFLYLPFLFLCTCFSLNSWAYFAYLYWLF